MIQVKGLNHICKSIVSCLDAISGRFSTFRDYRLGSNPQYDMRDFVLGVFSIFFLNNSSFLEQQRTIQKAEWFETSWIFLEMSCTPLAKLTKIGKKQSKAAIMILAVSPAPNRIIKSGASVISGTTCETIITGKIYSIKRGE